MSTYYVTQIQVDKGERIHIKSEVMPVCEEDIPFVITSATWKLLTSDSSEILEEGDCDINGHILDALIDFTSDGTYCLKYTYQIADEIWVDNVKMNVR